MLMLLLLSWIGRFVYASPRGYPQFGIPNGGSPKPKKHGVIQCFSKVLADDRLSSYCWAGTGVSQPGGDLHERHHGSMDGWMNGWMDGWVVSLG